MAKKDNPTAEPLAEQQHNPLPSNPQPSAEDPSEKDKQEELEKASQRAEDAEAQLQKEAVLVHSSEIKEVKIVISGEMADGRTIYSMAVWNNIHPWDARTLVRGFVELVELKIW